MKKLFTWMIITAIPFTCLLSQNTDVLLPSPMDREVIIHHHGFSLSYNSGYVLPSWLTFKIYKSQVNRNDSYKGKYIADPGVQTRSASKKDYKDGGYIMAQLVNYIDVAGIEGAQDESFYMSNIVPMKLAFYNHIWIKTEDLIRLWVSEYGPLYVVTGPVLNEGPFPTIGENNLSVPKRYYKAVYDPANQKAVGFIFKNGTTSGTLKSYAMSVDKLESEIGIDLFPALDDSIENRTESEFDPTQWDFEKIN